MTDRSALRPWTSAARSASSACSDCPGVGFWRYLYTEVGEAYHWVDRLPWSDDEIRAYLDDPDVSLWVMSVAGALAGYFELRMEPDGGMEIVVFRPAAASSPAADSAGIS